MYLDRLKNQFRLQKSQVISFFIEQFSINLFFNYFFELLLCEINHLPNG